MGLWKTRTSERILERKRRKNSIETMLQVLQQPVISAAEEGERNENRMTLRRRSVPQIKGATRRHQLIIRSRSENETVLQKGTPELNNIIVMRGNVMKRESQVENGETGENFTPEKKESMNQEELQKEAAAGEEGNDKEDGETGENFTPEKKENMNQDELQKEAAAGEEGNDKEGGRITVKKGSEERDELQTVKGSTEGVRMKIVWKESDEHGELQVKTNVISRDFDEPAKADENKKGTDLSEEGKEDTAISLLSNVKKTDFETDVLIQVNDTKNELNKHKSKGSVLVQKQGDTTQKISDVSPNECSKIVIDGKIIPKPLSRTDLNNPIEPDVNKPCEINKEEVIASHSSIDNISISVKCKSHTSDGAVIQGLRPKESILTDTTPDVINSHLDLEILSKTSTNLPDSTARMPINTIPSTYIPTSETTSITKFTETKSPENRITFKDNTVPENKRVITVSASADKLVISSENASELSYSTSEMDPTSSMLKIKADTESINPVSALFEGKTLDEPPRNSSSTEVDLGTPKTKSRPSPKVTPNIAEMSLVDTLDTRTSVEESKPSTRTKIKPRISLLKSSLKKVDVSKSKTGKVTGSAQKEAKSSSSIISVNTQKTKPEIEKVNKTTPKSVITKLILRSKPKNVDIKEKVTSESPLRPERPKTPHNLAMRSGLEKGKRRTPKESVDSKKTSTESLNAARHK